MGGKVRCFIPCLVDQVMPEIGFAMIRILRHLGYSVEYDPAQTCCGQPGFNAGHWKESRQVACHCLDVFNSGDGPIVSPSGSCTSMMRHHYRELFEGHPRASDAARVGGQVVEFAEFIQREGRLDDLRGHYAGTVGVHKSCHAYRELGLRELPMALLRGIDGCELVEPEGEPVCCGFGGTFFVKFPPIAQSMGRSRLLSFTALQASVLVVNDPGCVMQLRQAAQREELPVKVLHTLEFLDLAMFPREAVSEPQR